MTVKLNATNAREARREIAKRFPQGAHYKGYDETGDCVLMSTVRERGNKAHVATATKGRKAVSFTCEPLS